MNSIEAYGFIPENRFLAMNDNREIGGDSRNLGLIPVGYITGRILVPGQTA
jgi:hypothetical protein